MKTSLETLRREATLLTAGLSWNVEGLGWWMNLVSSMGTLKAGHKALNIVSCGIWFSFCPMPI